MLERSLMMKQITIHRHRLVDIWNWNWRFYQDFWNDKNKYDNSDYPEYSPYFNKTNKKVIGKFNDETSNIAITQFVALSYKMYSHNTDDEKSDRTSKGIKKIVIKKAIKMYYSITNKCVIKWKPLRATIINLEVMNEINCHSTAFMISDTFMKIV